MGALRQDLRFGLRVLTKAPGFVLVAVLTLGLGIGANTAIFSLIDAVMLRTLAVPHPERLVVFSWKAHHQPKMRGASSYGDCPGNGETSGCSFSVPLFEQIRSQASVFSGLTAFAGAFQLDLSGSGPASLKRGEIVAGDYFTTLGVNAAAGRVLGPADDSPSAPAALVLSYSYWQNTFGGDQSAVGRTIRLNNVPFTIVGVADPHFTNRSSGRTLDLWLPLTKVPVLNMSWLTPDVRNNPQTWWMVMVGRLKPGVSIGEAQSAATVIFRNEMLHGAKPFSQESDDPQITLRPVQEGLTGARRQYSTLLYVLMCVVGLVLLITCANVAGLMLARSAARQKEIAVRLALGAGRGRIARQLLTESLALSILGGGLGILVAYWGVDAITALMSSDPDRQFGFVVAPDWRVLAFTIAATLLAGVFFGLAPALSSSRVDLTPALKENAATLPPGATGRRVRLGDALVVTQVALSILVLIGAGLLVRTLQNLRNVKPGFEARNVLLFGIEPTLSGYKDAQTLNLYRDLRDRFAAIPGVESVSYSSDALLSGGLWSQGIHFPGQPEKSSVEADVMAVGPGFFATMDIPLLSGRTFTPADLATAATTDAAEEAQEAGKKAVGSGTAAPNTKAAPVLGAPITVVVNEAFARKFFRGENPLGQHFEEYQDEPGEASASYQVIGVAADAKYSDLRREIQPMIYRPHTGGGAHFELRTTAKPGAVVAVVRDIVNRVDSNLPLFDIRTQSEQIEQLLGQERLIARLSSFFGILALALACIGLYGLLAYEVTRRTREIGIRMALGAQRDRVLRLVVREGITLAIVGGAFGLAAAFGVMRYLASLLYGVRPFDPLTFAAVAVLLFSVALAACYIPARRATRVDPLVALRHE